MSIKIKGQNLMHRRIITIPNSKIPMYQSSHSREKSVRTISRAISPKFMNQTKDNTNLPREKKNE
jgi:hypothetical protein